MHKTKEEAIIKLLEDIKQATAQIHAGVEIALPYEEHGAIINREHVLTTLKSVLASANTGVELLKEQSKQIELTTEEQQMLDGIRLGLAPFPTPNNFTVLWSLATKGVIPAQQSKEAQG